MFYNLRGNQPYPEVLLRVAALFLSLRVWVTPPYFLRGLGFPLTFFETLYFLSVTPCNHCLAAAARVLVKLVLWPPFVLVKLFANVYLYQTYKSIVCIAPPPPICYTACFVLWLALCLADIGLRAIEIV